MATDLLFLDSFDHYSTAQFLRKWTVGVGSIVPGRTGNGLQIFGGGPEKTLGIISGATTERDTLYAGMAYNTQAFANWIWQFSNQVNGITTQVNHIGDGRVRFHYAYTGGAADGDTISPPLFNTNEWYYVEMKSQVSFSAPNLTFNNEFRVNENPVLSETFSLNCGSTTFGSHAKFAQISPGGPGGGFHAIIDDLYVTDSEYLGDIKIAVLYPNAAGASTTWTPNVSMAANYNMVKEHPPDDDTTVNTASTTGLIDYYNLDDIVGFTGTIKGAQALWLTKKSDTGTGAIKGLWSAGSGHQTPEFFPSNLSYLYLIDPQRSSLDTGIDWTVGEINSLQLGIQRTQ